MTNHADHTEFEAATVTTGNAVMAGAEFLAALSAVNSVIERRNYTPILGNARIVAVGEFCHITGTNLDLELTATIPAEPGAAMATTLPGKMMLELAKAAKSGTIAISAGDDGHDLVAINGASCNVQKLPATDFPNLDRPVANALFMMPGETIREAFESVAFAISHEETRYYLNGVFFHVAESAEGRRLAAVATDGHRLGRWQGDVPEGAEGMPEVIIPRKAVETLLKLWRGKKCPESVLVAVSTSKIQFDWDGYSLVTKLIDGTFPDYRRVIPMHNARKLTFESGAMQLALGAATVISSERGRAVKFVLENEKLSLSVRNPDQGESTAEFRGTWESDSPMEIGLNSRYVADIIKAACPGKAGGTITMEMQDAGAPVRITGTNPACDFVQMPMRV